MAGGKRGLGAERAQFRRALGGVEALSSTALTMGLLSRILGRKRPPVPVTMYVRKPCKLCDVMKAELDRAGLGDEYELRIVDLDREASEQLRSDHGPQLDRGR